jgi:hypothetical protein
MTADNGTKYQSRRGAALCGGILLAIAVTYVGTYLCLTLKGRYETTSWGTSSLVYYAWMPAGFARPGKINVPLLRAFTPLYWLDVEYWHTMDRADSGRYPVNDDEFYLYGTTLD